MLITQTKLRRQVILSIQTGGQVAYIKNFIIDPATLKIEAYRLAGALVDPRSSILSNVDIREFSPDGLIVDSIDSLVADDDILKLKPLIEQDFQLLGRTVTDTERHKLGKVIDSTVDTDSSLIIQLVIKRPMLRSLNDTELIVHRSQIVEINDKSIVVQREATMPEPSLREVVGSYSNPFRKSANKPIGVDSATQIDQRH